MRVEEFFEATKGDEAFITSRVAMSGRRTMLSTLKIHRIFYECQKLYVSQKL